MKVRAMARISISSGRVAAEVGYMHYGIYRDGGMKVRAMPKISMSLGGGSGGWRYIHYSIYIRMVE